MPLTSNLSIVSVNSRLRSSSGPPAAARGSAPSSKLTKGPIDDASTTALET